MCNSSCINFGKAVLNRENVFGKSVIEVGAYNVNGSLRTYIESLMPQRYLGVDIELGPSVDEVCPAEDLTKTFGLNSFDIVISTEMVEHVRDWQVVMHNLKGITKPGGLILVTTRSEGFPLHGYPFDYWRYGIADMKAIFEDCEICSLELDCDDPGVLLFAKKPIGFTEKSLRSHKLFSIIVGKKVSTRYAIFSERFAVFKHARDRAITEISRLLKRAFFYARHPFGLPGVISRKLGRMTSSKE